MKSWSDVWARVAGGQHALVIDGGEPSLPDPAELRVLVVDCSFAADPGGALGEALHRVERLLPRRGAVPRAEQLRRHLFEQHEESALDAFVAACARLESLSDQTTVLLLRSVDHADRETLEALLDLLTRPGRGPLPLLLCLDRAPTAGASLELLEAFRRGVGEAGVVTRPSGGGDDSSESPPVRLEESLARIGSAARLVLRAGATVGDRFEVEVLAELLDVDALEVLCAVQEAVDQGLPIEDRREGRFRLDGELAVALRRGTLPSLSSAWHRRLAELFGGLPGPAPGVAASAEPSEPLRVDAGQRERPGQEGSSANDGREPVPRRSDEAPPDSLFEREGATPATGASRPPEFWDELERSAERARGALEADRRRDDERAGRGDDDSAAGAARRWPDHGRAAAHFEAVGDWGLAAQRQLEAADAAGRSNAHRLALERAERALLLAGRLPRGLERRLLEMRSLMAVGHARWRGHGDARDQTLGAALEALQAAREHEQETDPAVLRARLGSLIASVSYDVGTEEALQTALSELQRAGRALLDASRPLDAASLLNDEATVWVRLGDPVRANYLLSRAREVFGRVAASYPPARAELAETEHLVGRLVLHARPRPGRERDALSLGVEHARAAEEAYDDLGDHRAKARVRETLGRLLGRMGRTADALSSLEDARSAQRDLGDAIGLARTSAALADVLSAAGRHEEALEQLAASAHFNLDKGAPAGLAFNLEALRRLAGALPERLAEAASELEQRLEQRLEHGLSRARGSDSP